MSRSQRVAAPARGCIHRRGRAQHRVGDRARCPRRQHRLTVGLVGFRACSGSSGIAVDQPVRALLESCGDFTVFRESKEEQRQEKKRSRKTPTSSDETFEMISSLTWTISAEAAEAQGLGGFDHQLLTVIRPKLCARQFTRRYSFGRTCRPPQPVERRTEVQDSRACCPTRFARHCPLTCRRLRLAPCTMCSAHRLAPTTRLCTLRNEHVCPQAQGPGGQPALPMWMWRPCARTQ